MAKENVKQKVLKWCKEEEIFVEEGKDPNSKFNFIIKYPRDINHLMSVVQSKEKKDQVTILCLTNVSPEHLDKMKETAKKEMDEFLWDMRFTLCNRPTEFDLSISKGALRLFAVSASINYDGLTKDRFISAIRDVYKSKLLGVWKIQRKFGEV